jgi:hypothetical protein
VRFWRFCGQDGQEESSGRDYPQIRSACSVASEVADG